MGSKLVVSVLPPMTAQEIIGILQLRTNIFIKCYCDDHCLQDMYKKTCHLVLQEAIDVLTLSLEWKCLSYRLTDGTIGE